MLNLKLNLKYTGIDQKAIMKYKENVEQIHKELHKRANDENDFVGWLELPTNYDKEEFERIKKLTIKPTEQVNKFLEENNSSTIKAGVKLADLLKRTELNYDKLSIIDPERPELSKAEAQEVEIQVKYEGYIKMQEEQVKKFKKLEDKKLSENINYDEIKGLRIEARQKLNKVKPLSIGQASRISGVSPADVSVLLIYLEQQKRK